MKMTGRFCCTPCLSVPNKGIERRTADESCSVQKMDLLTEKKTIQVAIY
jgi:hypothetical protein